MLRGEKVGLRARIEADVPVLEAELYNDLPTQERADGRPWQPISPGTEASRYRVIEPNDNLAGFSVVDLASEQLAGSAALWGIDLHNRCAHIGLAILPTFRGKGLGTDVVRVLCRYGFNTRGLNRLQIETLADNHAMLRAAEVAGFTRDGVLRRAAWVHGQFLDEVVLGLLADEWKAAG